MIFVKLTYTHGLYNLKKMNDAYIHKKYKKNGEIIIICIFLQFFFKNSNLVIGKCYLARGKTPN